LSVIIIILAYFLGAIPFGVIFARLKGVNLLESGSRSSGATNAFRTAGPVVGIFTVIFDILKGFVAVWLAYLYAHEINWVVYIAGVASIFGHTKSVFLGFKGGKAIATSFGVFLFLNPVPILITLVIWILTIIISRMVSLGSIVAGIVYPITTLIYTPDQLFLILISFAVAIWAIWRHKENIKRIMNGTESKIGQKKRDLK
jgi:glycerol-3-phosphate acyltransferase PlsY